MPRKPKKSCRHRPLNARQQKFLDEFLLSDNAVQSYRKAYPSASYRAAAASADTLLKNPVIVAELEAARKDMRDRLRLAAERVLAKRTSLAFSDIGDVLDLTDATCPKLKPYDQIPLEARRAIQSLQVTKDGVKVKLFDQNASLSMLEKRLGLAQEITPLDALLAMFPAEVGARIRELLAGALSGKPGPPGDAPAVPPQ